MPLDHGWGSPWDYTDGVAPDAYSRRLYLAENGPLRKVLQRGALAGLLLGVAWLMLWLARDGLKDNSGQPLGALDVLYFAVVTVTTLGYGDIVPVTPSARAIVTFGITLTRSRVVTTPHGSV